MTFKIVVCIKQVPDTSDIKWTEHNTIQREGLDSIINPFDIGAIQLAKNVKFLLKERISDIEIVCVSMGPLQAQEALKSAIAMGCDSAYLLCDKKFAGSDTLATAYTLSQFIRVKVPDYKIIICGQQAIDGDTAQTPSSMAQKLKIGQITNVIALKDVNEAYSVWISDTSEAKKEIKSGYPVLIATTLKDVNMLPDINGYIKAQETKINVLNAEDIGADSQLTGLKGSPTQVKKAYKPVIDRNTILIENQSTKDYAGFIIDEITKCRAEND